VVAWESKRDPPATEKDSREGKNQLPNKKKGIILGGHKQKAAVGGQRASGRSERRKSCQKPNEKIKTTGQDRKDLPGSDKKRERGGLTTPTTGWTGKESLGRSHWEERYITENVIKTPERGQTWGVTASEQPAQLYEVSSGPCPGEPCSGGGKAWRKWK